MKKPRPLSARRFAVPACLAALLLNTGCMMVNLGDTGGRELRELTLEKPRGWLVAGKVLVVNVSGIITDQEDPGLFGGDETCTPGYLKAVLNKAENDASVTAVVLRIDSPGGSVSASQLLAREIAAFRGRTGVPVYAHIHAIGCSGAYFLAASCDRIHIQPAGISGSIGVIATLPKVSKLADKIGYEQVVFKSGPMKDIGNFLRDMTEEEKAVFQGIINSSYDDFLDWILRYRPASGPRDALKTVADGRIYDANQALEKKLVDRISYLDETIRAAMEAAGVKDARIVTYGYRDDPDANLYSSIASSPDRSLLRFKLPASLSPPRAGFYYLWIPGE